MNHLQRQAYRHFTISLPLDAAFRQLTLEAEQGDGGQVHVHVNGVKPGDDGRIVGLFGRYKGANRNKGTANTAGNGGIHFGVAKVDLGTFNLPLSALYLACGLFFRCYGIIIVLLAYGVFADKLLVAPDFGLGCAVYGHCLRQLPTGGVIHGFVAGWVNLVELLACHHIGPFGKQAFEHNAGDLWADLSNFKRIRTAGQAGVYTHRLGFHGNHANGLRWHLRCALLAFTASKGK